MFSKRKHLSFHYDYALEEYSLKIFYYKFLGISVV